MSLSTITTKGQITIPKVIRDQLHLTAGDKVDFILTETGEVIVKPISDPVDSIVGIIKTKKRATIDDMNTAIAQRTRSAR